jgi:starch phosphorylase
MLPIEGAAEPGLCTFAARVATGRPAADFTPRVLPYHELALPVEVPRILWQR